MKIIFPHYFIHKSIKGGIFHRDRDGRLSGELLNIGKGNCYIFEGYNMKELHKAFIKAAERWLRVQEERADRALMEMQYSSMKRVWDNPKDREAWKDL